MNGLERGFVEQAFESNWLSTVGPNLSAFEAEMSEKLNGLSTLAVSSGTAALHLVLRAAGVGPGDTVALSTLTFAGSLYPILYLGAQPVFIDSERKSWNMDPGLLEEYLRDAAGRNRLPKAIVVVHLYGQHADLDVIEEMCGRYEITLIEDAAESLGATYKGRPTATTGTHSILSFNGNKIITTTGGGMVVSKDEAAVHRMRKWANQSREPTLEYLHKELGYNYRMSNILAGIGRGQLQTLEQRVVQRREVFRRYQSAFADLHALVPQPEAAWGTHTRWLSVFSVKSDGAELDANGLINSLGQVGIEARPVWRPMHTQPLTSEAQSVGGSVADDLYRTGVCLPSSSSLTKLEQDEVIAVVREYFVGSLQDSKAGTA
jgi:dTDP-4-amino-4,6-dideoxygalactose transaminase